MNKRMVGFGATAVAFGTMGLVAEDDDFQTGMFIAASVALFSPALIRGYRQYAKLFKGSKKAGAVIERKDSVVAREVDSINASLGARASAKPGTITTQTTTTITTFTSFENIAEDAPPLIARQTAAIDVAVSKAAHMSNTPGNSAYLRSLLPASSSKIRI